MINRVVLTGRLTKDPELRYTPSGVAVATFTVAVRRSFQNQQGEYESDFINCVVWRRPAENMANFTKKGSLVGVDGRLQTRNYEGQDGKRVYVTEVVAESVQFLETKGNGNNGNGNNNSNNNNQNNQNNQNNNDNGYGGGYLGGKHESGYDPFANDGHPIDISDDDLPF